ncbi:MAG: hypothetical protein ACT4P7_10420, partial [Gemmatimonadaceae bacterium]
NGFTSQMEFANPRLACDGRGRSMIELDCERTQVEYRDVPMRAGARHDCTLLTRIPDGALAKPWQLVIRQHIGGRWVGALTFQFGPEYA